MQRSRQSVLRRCVSLLALSPCTSRSNAHVELSDVHVVHRIQRDTLRSIPRGRGTADPPPVTGKEAFKACVVCGVNFDPMLPKPDCSKSGVAARAAALNGFPRSSATAEVVPAIKALETAGVKKALLPASNGPP